MSFSERMGKPSSEGSKYGEPCIIFGKRRYFGMGRINRGHPYIDWNGNVKSCVFSSCLQNIREVHAEGEDFHTILHLPFFRSGGLIVPLDLAPGGRYTNT